MALESRQLSCGEQFHATLAWNTIVSAVRAELPLGRHRKGLRTFTNCFPGNDAVSWTLGYLQRNREALFHPQRGEPTSITREKVTLLLQKFVEQKIIEDVRGRGQEFKDSSHHLYTFSRQSVLPLATCYLQTASRDKGYVRKPRSRSLSHITPPTMRCATRLVKLALLVLSARKVHRHQSES